MIKSHNETEVWFEERKKMKLKNVLIVVKDIERSKQFYHDLLGNLIESRNTDVKWQIL